MHLKPVRVSQTVLDEVTVRALRFLEGVAKSPELYARLPEAGYTEAEQARGWALLKDACGTPVAQAPAPPEVAAVAAAVAELTAWAGPNLRRIRAALTSPFPAQCQRIFASDVDARGVGAPWAVAVVLREIDRLERSRKCAADRAAVALLARRGFTVAERSRVARLFERATTLPPAVRAPRVEIDTAHRAARLELLAWYRDWAATAKAVLTNRAHLITLGLAQRRATKGDADVGASSARPQPGGGRRPR